MKKLIFFTSTWCQPCKTFKPIMEKLSNQYPITFIDVDISPQTSVKYNVRNIPTTILIDGQGKELGRLIGVKTEAEIIALYNR